MAVILNEINLTQIDYLDPERASAEPTVFLAKRERTIAPAQERRITDTMIVCLDCADPFSSSPRKTFLTTSGRCDGCGGCSYLLASKIYSRREELL